MYIRHAVDMQIHIRMSWQSCTSITIITVILSEHNIFIEPATLNLPADRSKGFILVRGQVVTGKKHIHTTAMSNK